MNVLIYAAIKLWVFSRLFFMHRLECASAYDFAGLYALRIWPKKIMRTF